MDCELTYERKHLNRWLRLVSAAAMLLMLASCSDATEAEGGAEVEAAVESSASNEGSSTEPDDALGEEELSEIAAPSVDLPVLAVFEDEAGPSDLVGMLTEADQVLQAKLVEVQPGLRYYGPDSEAPDATVFEEIGLVFEVAVDLKGGSPGTATITLPWTGYSVQSKEPGAERIEQVALNGLIINEASIGRSFGLFVTTEQGRSIPLTTEGIIPLSKNGLIEARDTRHGGVLVHDIQGQSFIDSLEALDSSGLLENQKGDDLDS